jgi:hypothetical protein
MEKQLYLFVICPQNNRPLVAGWNKICFLTHQVIAQRGHFVYGARDS